MKKLEKVSEPRNGCETWECPRCKQGCCSECSSPVMVEFKISDEPEGENDIVDWEEESVCPWCYNQLVDKFNGDEE